ncbi:MAG: transcriptional regulator [Flavobacteriaceae bacterium]|nr:MAG: transcriptional regulator [Flavobacteriaceae bacterium]
MKNNITCIRIDADKDQISQCKQTIHQLDDSILLLAKALNLAGNEVRLKILFLLNKETALCVCDLSDILNMKVSAISQHLRKLKDGNIILSNRKAQTIYYRLAPEYAQLFGAFFTLINNDKILSYETQ